MRLVLGLSTLATAAVAGAMWFSPMSAEDELAVVSEVGAGGVARVARAARPTPERVVVYKEANAPTGAADAADSGRFFGFAVPSILADRSARPTETVQASGPAAGMAAVPRTWATDVVLTGAQAAAGEQPVIAGAHVVATSAPASVVVPKPVIAQPRDRSRPELVRELQRELKRVGCYAGEADGDWGIGSKRSMRSFLDQVNSKLQSDEPDLFQLTLVSGYSGTACRASPSTPPAIMANRTPAPVASAYAPPAYVAPTYGTAPASPMVVGAVDGTTTNIIPRTTLEGRMSVGGPAALAPVPPPLTAAPVYTAPRPAQRPRLHQAQPSGPRRAATAQPQRRERSWTATFFSH